MRAQHYEKIIDDDNVTIDSVLVAKFPKVIPPEFKQLIFKKQFVTRLHDGRIDIIFNNDLFERRTELSGQELKDNRRNIGIYYTSDLVENAVLYKHGIAVSNIGFYPDKNGMYILILMELTEADIYANNFNGKVVMASVNNDKVVMSYALQPD